MLGDDVKCASERTCFVWVLGVDCWVMMKKCASEGTCFVWVLGVDCWVMMKKCAFEGICLINKKR